MNAASSFCWRRRRWILGGSLVVGGAYAAYVMWGRRRLERMIVDTLIEGLKEPLPPGGATRDHEARLRSHFADTQRECAAFCGRELPRLLDQLDRHIDLAAIRAQMRGVDKRTA